jgi:hypothetical protein
VNALVAAARPGDMALVDNALDSSLPIPTRATLKALWRPAVRPRVRFMPCPLPSATWADIEPEAAFDRQMSPKTTVDFYPVVVP